MRFYVQPRALRQVARFVGAERRRAVLGAVLIQRDGTLVATDGTQLLCWRNAVVEGAVPRDVLLAFPREVLAAAGRVAAHVVEITADDADAAVPVQVAVLHRSADALLRVTLTECEGPYPPWRAVLPRDEDMDTTHVLVSYDAERLAAFTLAGKGAPSVLTLMTSRNGHGASVVTYQDEPDVIGLLMPRRWQPVAPVVPAWVRGPQAPSSTGVAQ